MTSVLTEDARRFAALFAGLDRAKGRYMAIHDPTRPQAPGDKSKGRATTLSEPVTQADYTQHVEGLCGLGIVPVRDDGTCVFGAVDIDQYTGLDHKELVAILATHKIPAYVCKSKSGGAHVYVFIEEPGVKAPPLIEFLKSIRTRLGVDYRKAREIFPKQKAQSGGIGNWINLPYFGEARQCVGLDGAPVALHDFLAQVTPLKPTEVASEKIGEGVVVSELPPCLEHLMKNGIPAGMRNEAMFNYAVFAAKRYQDDRDKGLKMLKVINEQTCQPPIAHKELVTIADSVARHEYNYRCEQSPIVDCCNKTLCATRPYGPHASIRPSDIPEILKIELHGHADGETQFYVTLAVAPTRPVKMEQIFDYRLFRKVVMAVLHEALPNITQKRWDNYLVARWGSINETVRVESTRSKQGLLLEALDSWIKQQGHPDPMQFALGFPYFEGGMVYINLHRFAVHARPITKYDHSQVAGIIEDCGWTKIDKTIGDTRYEGLWCHPYLYSKETTRVLPETPPQGTPAAVASGEPAGAPPEANWADYV